MTEMEETNAMDGKGEAGNPVSDLGQAQIICVIGKTIFAFSLYYALLTQALQADPASAKAHNAQNWPVILALRMCQLATS